MEYIKLFFNCLTIKAVMSRLVIWNPFEYKVHSVAASQLLISSNQQQMDFYHIICSH